MTRDTNVKVVTVTLYKHVDYIMYHVYYGRDPDVFNVFYIKHNIRYHIIKQQ